MGQPSEIGPNLAVITGASGTAPAAETDITTGERHIDSKRPMICPLAQAANDQECRV